MAPQPRPGILDIRPYKGGLADAPGFEAPVKLSSNENPLGCSPAARAALCAMQDSLERYPDGAVTRLREALAARHGLPVDQIVCGNGSDELLNLLGQAYLRPGDEVIHAQNGFLSYHLVALKNGARPVAAPETDMRIDAAAFLSCVSPRTRMVFVANPNNPTGFLLPAEELRALHAGLPEDVLLVIDGAYAEFVDAADYDGGFGLVRAHDNVVATRTFSKAYGLAALRVGWAFCPPQVCAALERVRCPFNVNAPGQAAALAALDDTAFLQRSIDHVRHWRAWLGEALGALGLKVYPSAGNFVLIGFASEGQAEAAERYLMARGLILRAMGGFGLPGHLRMSIGLERDNQAVVAALKAFLSEERS